MEFNNIPVFNTYGRFPVVLTKGEGCRVFDDKGNSYLDCLAGIAVVSAGHGNSEIAEAVSDQMKKLTHVSNFFWNEPMAELATRLRETTGGWGRVFFANSGAEANECAIKLVRKWGAPDRNKIICFEGAFHGRTLGALAATGQPAKWKGFEPLPVGFVHVPFNNLDAVEQAIDNQTVAIMLEPIQGEKGVIPAEEKFIKGIRSICSSKNLALILDEIQTGVGRTGNWWAFQSYGVKPDIFTSAKALANGLPIGACIAEEPFASVLVPGDHATTFGGGAVVARAAVATLDYLAKNKIIEEVESKSQLFRRELSSVSAIKEIRGKGLMLGAVLKSETAADVVKSALERGLIINAAAPDTIRIVPPLIISQAEIKEACKTIAEILKT